VSDTFLCFELTNNLSQILSDLDCSFFLVTVDLWSADGQHEMNLVLHPSSTERHPSSKPKKKGGSTSTPAHRPTQPGHSTPTTHYRATEVIDVHPALNQSHGLNILDRGLNTLCKRSCTLRKSRLLPASTTPCIR
jgi:hypothetical protein